MSTRRLTRATMRARLSARSTALREQAAARSAAMEERSATRRGTRRRAAVPVVVGLTALTGMFQLVSSSALAVNFSTSDKDFKLYSNYLQGAQAAGFLSTQTTGSGLKNGSSELGIRSAKLAGLCAIAYETLPAVGDVSLMVIAGVPVKSSFNTGANTTTDGAGNPLTFDANGLLTGGNHIEASNLFVNTKTMNGFGNKISGLNLGQSGDTVAATAGITWPTGQTAPAVGGFGLSADRLNIGGLGGDTAGINLQGAITLPNLKIKVLPGKKTQADCPTEAN